MALIGTTVLVWMHRDSILFWDTVQLAGKHGLWFHDTGLQWLPTTLDSGNPPTLGLYLAAMWRGLGKSLMVSHLSMLPFLWLNVLLIWKIGDDILLRPTPFLAAALLCPFYLGHSILVSPDIVLMTGFLACLHGHLSKSSRWMLVGGLLLSVVSMRGQMILCCWVAFLFLSSLLSKSSLKVSVRKLSILLPGLLLIMTYQGWHYVQQSWVGFHDDMPWAPSFQWVGLKGWVRQVGLFGWRMLDHGLVFATVLVGLHANRIRHMPHRLGLLGLMVGGLLFVLLTPLTGLLNHRYFLPLIVIVLLMAFWILEQRGWSRWAWLLVVLIASGNFLIYPDKIAQGWDSTAAHWPFYELEKEMHDYIQSEGIELGRVGTAFPLRTSRRHLNLKASTTGHETYDLGSSKYILYLSLIHI